MTFILSFFKKFVIKWLTSTALEKVTIIVLGELVKRTDSDIDDKIYKAVFDQTKIEK